jgi:hypothetical protein
VLDTLAEKASRNLSKNGGDGWIGVYMWEGPTLGVMATDRLYGEFYDLHGFNLKYFVYYICNICFLCNMLCLLNLEYCCDINVTCNFYWLLNVL